MKRTRYTKDLPRRLYTYFHGYTGIGAPSLDKFAREAGMTLANLKEMASEHAELMRAFEECNEIRRDYLIDNALSKKQDASLTKFLLATEFGMGEDTGDPTGRLEVTVEVIGNEA